MAVLLLILASAGLLAYGYATDDKTYVWIALGASVAAVLLVLASRFGPESVRRVLAGSQTDPQTDTPVEPLGAATDEIDAGEDIADEEPGNTQDGRVAFVAGRMMFHDPDCILVKDKATSSALRVELETGGMNACRRCLKS